MWVITRVMARIDGEFERALEQAVAAEAESCPCCKAVLEASGALPTHCPQCKRKRGADWERQVEEKAARQVYAAKAEQNQKI